MKALRDGVSDAGPAPLRRDCDNTSHRSTVHHSECRTAAGRRAKGRAELGVSPRAARRSRAGGRWGIGHRIGDPKAVGLRRSARRRLGRRREDRPHLPVAEGDCENYTVQPNDKLTDIAKNYSTSVALILKENLLTSSNIRAGLELKVCDPRGAVHLAALQRLHIDAARPPAAGRGEYSWMLRHRRPPPHTAGLTE